MRPDAAALAGFLCAFVRTAAFFQSAPLLSDRMIPARFRAAAAVLVALAVGAGRPADPSGLALLIPGELLLGAAAGFSAKLAYAGAEAGGQLIGLQLGLGFAGVFDPTAGEESLPTRRMVGALAGLAFLLAGGLESSVRALAAGHVDGRTLGGAVVSVITSSGDVLVQAIRIAAPIILAAFVANVAMAVGSRAVPSLNVFSVMLASVALVGALVLFATAPALIRELHLVAERMVDAVSRTVSP